MNYKLITSVFIFCFFIAESIINAQSIPLKRSTESEHSVFAETSGIKPAVAGISQKGISDVTSKIKNPEPESKPKFMKVVNTDPNNLRLKNKIISLSNPVYQIIEYFEAIGYLGFIPQAKPYTKRYIADLLVKLRERENLS